MNFVNRVARFMGGKPHSNTADDARSNNSNAAPKPVASISTATALGVNGGKSHVQTTSSNSGSSPGFWNDPELLAVRLEYEDVEHITQESTRGRIEVWKGRYLGEDVTLRWVGDKSRSMSDAIVFVTEARIMARLTHPKITAFIGVAWSNRLRVEIVTEYMDSGELWTWLGTPQAKQLTWADGKCQIVIDVAEAVKYMHSLRSPPPHRDINARSILVDSVKVAKLSVFRASRFESDERMNVRSILWMSPEVLVGQLRTAASDVYALGVILSELDIHAMQNGYYSDTWSAELVRDLVRGNAGPAFTPECPQSILSLARSCLAFDPAARPRIEQVLTTLRTFQRATP